MATLDNTPLAKATPAERKEREAAERRGDPFVVYRRSEGAQRLFALHPGLSRVTIGRGPSNDISLSWDTDVSRVHAELERMGGHWTLADDGNGTWVNGEPITGRHRLRDGDIVKVGGTLIAFRLPKPQSAKKKAGGAGKDPAVPALSPAQRRVLEALCRPYKESEFATPASNQQIAEELFLSADAVMAHLRALCTAFGLDAVPSSQKRTQLALRAMQLGLVR